MKGDLELTIGAETQIVKPGAIALPSLPCSRELNRGPVNNRPKTFTIGFLAFLQSVYGLCSSKSRSSGSHGVCPVAVCRDPLGFGSEHDSNGTDRTASLGWIAGLGATVMGIGGLVLRAVATFSYSSSCKAVLHDSHEALESDCLARKKRSPSSIWLRFLQKKTPSDARVLRGVPRQWVR